ncbi:TraB/GumN family protein [Pseudoxanthomonas dokdonensis]|uniref:TraB/GumN family protein n=1 Tax=Pseudoxanthomonas dokdonensis TaxID=344882 RepID=UPI001FDFD549|nr:TraB/GumN family protein [Pseudoxanthomonas dokdonensis]
MTAAWACSASPAQDLSPPAGDEPGLIARQTPPVPLLWKVSDDDNAVYLLGSFHLLRPDDYPLSADVDAAYADAESLMFELSPDEMQSADLSSRMTRAAIRTDGNVLREDLDEATWQKLDDYASRNGLPLVNLSTFEPWFVALTISLIEMGKQGLDPGLGLDNHFMQAAAADGKPTVGLEQAQEQIDLLDGMDKQEQIQFVREVLDEADAGAAETEKLHAAWRAGDAATLGNEMAAEMKREYPRLYQRINVERNDKWVPRIEQQLSRPGSDDTLVVVGALHLLGADGVVQKLKAEGYRVERICSACSNSDD